MSTLPRGPLLLALCGTVLLVLMGTASAYILFDSPVAGADDGPAGAPGPTGSPTPTVPAGLATVQGARATNPPPSPVGAASGGPSGVAMPQGDLPNWKQVFADDFNGTSLAKGWGAYNGEISSTPGGLWKDSHVRVQDGKLQLLGYREGDRWVTGGLMNHGPATTLYGKYEVRFRADNADGVKYAILLWPDSNKWPGDGEIDFAEDGGGVRDGFSATVHFVTDGSRHETIQRNVKNDFSIWHTVGVEWSPGTLVYTLDSHPWTTVNTPHTPSKPMNLVIQTEAATTCGQWMTCVDATTPATVAVEVDWVTAYVHR